MKILRVILLALIIIFTGLIVTLKPKLQKQVRLENPGFQVGETIIWNSWFSNVSNELLESIKFPENELSNINNFYVKFDVEKSGRIKNIVVRTTPPEYFEVAEKYVTPAVKSLEGKAVLKFPPKSHKQVVTYTSGFVASDKTRFTTPSDFQSYEKVN